MNFDSQRKALDEMQNAAIALQDRGDDVANTLAAHVGDLSGHPAYMSTSLELKVAVDALREADVLLKYARKAITDAQRAMPMREED